MTRPDDAVAAYKSVIGELEAAAGALRERELRQVGSVARRLAELEVEAADAERRAALARLGVELQWDAVLDRLWHEAWMTAKPHPRPDSDADPAELDALVARAEEKAEAVLAAMRRRNWGFGPR